MSLAVVIHAPHDLRVEPREVPALAPTQVEVRVGAGGICGSDLHYFHDGGFGAVRIREPMVLGHEIAGTIAAVGSGVTRLREGDRVAVNPSLPCGACRYCRRGDPVPDGACRCRTGRPGRGPGQRRSRPHRLRAR